MGRPLAVEARPGTLVEEVVGSIGAWHPRRYGAAGLAERHDDVVYGAESALLRALFPRLVADLQLS